MNRIKEIREKKKVSQVSLSIKAGVSQPFLCDLENGRRGAKPDTLKRIAEALGVDVLDLEEAADGKAV